MTEGETIRLEQSPLAGARERALLVLGPGTFVRYPLPPRGEVVVGRAETVQVRVEDRSVSRHHARIRVQPGKITIEDLGSANGTFVNQVRIEAERPAEIVDPMDVIRFGRLLALVTEGPSVRSAPPHADLVVASPAMRALYELVDRVAPGTISVLLLGETGAGKEVVAREIHRRSPRANEPFLAINCGALAEGVLESELFGHEAGAFTGATTAKPGLLESAEGGTVFLDEIGEAPLGVQQKLLRVLDELQVLRVGGVKPRPIDVRFVSATNRELASEAEAGRFRRDLYFRLCGISIHVPSLRERIDEIEPLARSFLETASARLGVVPPALSPEAKEALERHAWPGNVRELRNAVDRATLLAGAGPVGPEHLGLAPPVAPSRGRPVGGLKNEIQELERARMVAALEAAHGNQTHAAEAIGMSRRAFVMKMDRYGIPRPKKRTEVQPITPFAETPTDEEATWIGVVDGPRCSRCGKLLLTATVEDDQSSGDEGVPLCPGCGESSRLGDLQSALALLPGRLAEEGFAVVERLSPETALAPVFRARREQLGDEVAIKVLPVVAGVSPKKVERFRTEARAMAQVRHANVVRVYDVRQRSDLVLLVMELVEGETLLMRIERLGKIPPAEVGRMGIALASALAAAGKQGIVHRNVKPSNVLVSTDGVSRLIDFGLAKDTAHTAPGVTSEGTPLGTIRYMPPEQLRNARAADHRSDVYALAATLYHALSGTVPHAASSHLDLLKRAHSGRFEAADRRPLEFLPPAIVETVMRAMHPDPAARPQVAAEFQEAFRRAFGQ